MKVISKEVERAIKEAIKLEVNGRKFFNHAADITEHETGKKMFRFLAEEEVRHFETFSNLISQALKDDEWKRYIDAELSREEAPLIEKLKERMKHAEGKGEVEALTIGMELEMSAIQYFQKALAESDDPKAQKIFRDIIEEEKFHYDLLQAQYDSVMHSGNWLDSAEFQMDGKW